MTPVVSVDRTAIAVRLANLLDTEVLTRLVAFAESQRDGDLMLTRDDGAIEISQHDRPRRRSAAN